MWIIDINVKEPITYQGALYELNCHQTPRRKSKFNISLCRRKSYQRTYLEDICSIFDQVRHMVLHFEVRLPNKHPTPKNIGEGLKGHQRQFWKESLFVHYDNNRNVNPLLDTIPIKPLPEGTKVIH